MNMRTKLDRFLEIILVGLIAIILINVYGKLLHAIYLIHLVPLQKKYLGLVLFGLVFGCGICK